MGGGINLKPEEKGPEGGIGQFRFGDRVDREGKVSLELSGARAEARRVVLQPRLVASPVPSVAHREGVLVAIVPKNVQEKMRTFWPQPTPREHD